MARWRGRIAGRTGPAVTVVATTVLLSGCWFQLGASGGSARHNPSERTLTPETVGGLHTVWSVELGGDNDRPGEAMVADGRALVTVDSESTVDVRAFDLADGTVAWNANLLALPGDGVFATGTDVTIQGDQVLTGRLGVVPVWPHVPGPVCIDEEFRLDLDTGERSSDVPTFAYPSPTASDGGVVARTLFDLPEDCIFSDAQVTLDVAVNRPGAPATRWRSGVPGATTAVAPRVAGDRVLLLTGGRLDAYAATGCGTGTCAPAWSRTFPTPASNPIMGRTGPIHLVSAGNLLAIDRATGAEVWRAPVSSPALALPGGTLLATVAAPGGGDALAAFDAAGCGQATCAPTWTAPLSGTAPGSVVVGGRVAYVSTSDAVQAFDVSGCGAPACPALATVPVAGSGTLSVGDGHVLVRTGTSLTALAG